MTCWASEVLYRASSLGELGYLSNSIVLGTGTSAVKAAIKRPSRGKIKRIEILSLLDGLDTVEQSHASGAAC